MRREFARKTGFIALSGRRYAPLSKNGARGSECAQASRFNFVLRLRYSTYSAAISSAEQMGVRLRCRRSGLTDCRVSVCCQLLALLASQDASSGWPGYPVLQSQVGSGH